MGVSKTKHLLTLRSAFSLLWFLGHPELCIQSLQSWHCQLLTPAFVERSLLLSLSRLRFKITISDTVHCSRRICNKTKLSDLGWTNVWDSFKNSWGTRGTFCSCVSMQHFPSPLQADQTFCDSAAVWSRAFQVVALLIKTLRQTWGERASRLGCYLQLPLFP